MLEILRIKEQLSLIELYNNSRREVLQSLVTKAIDNSKPGDKYLEDGYLKKFIKSYLKYAKNPSNNIEILDILKIYLNSVGDIYLPDSNEQVLFYSAKQTELRGEGEERPLDRELYRQLLDASSVINPVIKPEETEETELDPKKKKDQTLFQIAYSNRNVPLLVELLSREEFEGKELRKNFNTKIIL